MPITAFGLGYVLTAKDMATAPINRVRGSVAGLAKESVAASVMYNRSMKQLKRGAMELVAGGGAIAVMNSLGKSYGTFEMGLVSAGTVMRASEGDMRRLEKAAIDAGIATQFSPTEAVKGLESLGAAGMNATDSISTLKPVLDLAAASLGQLGVGEAATNVVGVMNAFGESVDKAALRTDQLVRITQMSNFQARDFSIAISQAAAQANAADQSFESMTATLGLLRNMNLDASSSATAYREATRRLAGDKRALKVLTDMGISSLDKENNKIKDLGQIIAELVPKMAKMDAQQRNLNLKTIFGVRGMKTYSAFVMSYTKAVKEGKVAVGDYAGAHSLLVEGLENAAGTAEMTREKLLATSQGQRILLQGTVETLKVVAGKALVPVLLPALQAITGALNGFIRVLDAIPAPIKEFGSYFIGVNAALMAVTGSIRMLVGARGLLLLGRQAKTAAVSQAALATSTAAAAKSNEVFGRVIRLNRQASRGFVGVLKGIGGGVLRNLPLIGIGVSAMSGLFSMMRKRENEESTRVLESRREQAELQSSYIKTMEIAARQKKTAAAAADALVQAGKKSNKAAVENTVKSQEKILKLTEKFQKALVDSQVWSDVLKRGLLSKGGRAEAIANLKKARLARETSRGELAVYKGAELQLRARIASRVPAIKRTEEQSRTIIAARLSQVRNLEEQDQKIREQRTKARASGQTESVKKLTADLVRIRKQRGGIISRTGRMYGMRGSAADIQAQMERGAAPVMAGIRGVAGGAGMSEEEEGVFTAWASGKRDMPQAIASDPQRKAMWISRYQVYAKGRKESTGYMPDMPTTAQTYAPGQAGVNIFQPGDLQDVPSFAGAPGIVAQGMSEQARFDRMKTAVAEGISIGMEKAQIMLDGESIFDAMGQIGKNRDTEEGKVPRSPEQK